MPRTTYLEVERLRIFRSKYRGKHKDVLDFIIDYLEKHSTTQKFLIHAVPLSGKTTGIPTGE